MCGGSSLHCGTARTQTGAPRIPSVPDPSDADGSRWNAARGQMEQWTDDRPFIHRRDRRPRRRQHRAPTVPRARGGRSVVAVAPLDEGRRRLERQHRRRRRGVRRADRGRPAARRCGGRRPGAADDAQPSRVPLVRPRRAVPAGHAGQHLQLVVARGDPVPRQPRRRRGGDRRGRPLPRPVPRGARRAAGAETDLRDRRAGRGSPRRRRAGERARDAGQRRPRRARRRDRPDRHRHADLHERHDRPAEGRDDQPVQRRVHRRAAPRVPPVRRLRGHAGRVVPADGAHRRADDEPLPAADRRVRRVLLPRSRSADVVPEGGAPADRLRRAARLREDLQRGQRRARRRPGRARRSSTTASPPRSRSRRAERDGTATKEQLDTWAFLDAVAFRQVRALVGLDEVGHRDHRRGADPGVDPRVVRRDRCAVVARSTG